MLPSDYFRRNIFVSLQEDEPAIRFRDDIGIDTLQWGSDYPHIESTFPKSREILGKMLADCTEEERAKITWENAARVYNIDLN
jgi:predicted TIM-barrel fold metal-dependent hydrolase